MEVFRGGGVVLKLVCLWFQAPSRQVMHYWLQQLQQKRWEYSNTRGQRDSWCSPTLAYPLTGLVGKDNGRQVHTQFLPFLVLMLGYSAVYSFLSLYKNMNASNYSHPGSYFYLFRCGIPKRYQFVWILKKGEVECVCLRDPGDL